VLTLEIVLEDVQPRVWRLIEVPSTFTFFDLHSAIIDAMGWQDAHLHEFTIGDPRAAQPLRIGLPNDETPPAQATKYPRCIDGARACPPEDVGGPPGYFDFLAAASDPHHKEHHAVLRWAGGVWDAERFSPQTVRFKDPRHRLRRWREG
jgi:hypothetical protein